LRVMMFAVSAMDPEPAIGICPSIGLIP